MARTVKCPGCGADLTVKDDNREFMFCEYCGTKVRLDDYQETHRYVNEAEVKKVEAAREIELRKMEIEEQKRKESDDFAKKYLKIAPFLILGDFILMYLCDKFL